MSNQQSSQTFFERTFYFLLAGIALIAWNAQGFIFKEDLFGVLGLSYLMNTVLAGVIYGTIYKLREQHADKLGFIFLLGSGLKFAAYFILLHPVFNADGDMSTREFAIFFIPYALTTALETTALVRALNRS